MHCIECGKKDEILICDNCMFNSIIKVLNKMTLTAEQKEMLWNYLEQQENKRKEDKLNV